MEKIGEIKIELKRLERGTTKPLVKDIEILYPNRYKTDKKYVGIIDTGSDITRIDQNLLRKLRLIKVNEIFYKLEIKVKDLFNNEILVFDVQPYDITHNNKSDIKPNILLGRDFLSRCKMFYDGLNNQVKIEAYSI